MAVDQVKTRRVRFDENTIATFAVVAGVAGKTIKVKELHLVFVGANTLNIRTDATILASYPMIAGDQINLGMIEHQDRHFETVAGEDLNFALTAALRVTGFVVYEQS